MKKLDIRLYAFDIEEPSLPTLITYQFFHGNKDHLIHNMAFLFVFGILFETKVGWDKFLPLYIIGGVFSVFWLFLVGLIKYGKVPGGVYLGASGSISCIMSACLVACILSKSEKAISFHSSILSFRLKIANVLMLILLLLLARDILHAHDSIESNSLNGSCVHVGGYLFGFTASLMYCTYRYCAGIDYGWWGRKVLFNIRAPFYIHLCHKNKSINIQKRIRSEEILIHELIDLARLEALLGNYRTGESYYKTAIVHLWRTGNKNRATMLYMEFFQSYGKIFHSPFQLSLCQVLVDKKEYVIAASALELMVKEMKPLQDAKTSEMLEHAYWGLTEILSEKLNRQASARNYLKEYVRLFPKSKRKKEAIDKLHSIDYKLIAALV